MSKQSNKQTQNVKVVVNNKMCCDKPKPKKRRAKPKPPQEPIDDFPVLDTPANPRPSIHPVPVRNTVYMPSTVQISPEGMTPPIPAYFNIPYTNLVRTMEDMRKSVMDEINDVRRLVAPIPITNDTSTDPITPQMTMTEPQLNYNIAPSLPQATPSTSSQARTRTPPADMFEIPLGLDDMFGTTLETQKTPVAKLVNQFERLSTPKQPSPTGITLSQLGLEGTDRESVRPKLLEKKKEQLQELYNKIVRAQGRQRGRPPTKVQALANSILNMLDL